MVKVRVLSGKYTGGWDSGEVWVMLGDGLMESCEECRWGLRVVDGGMVLGW